MELYPELYANSKNDRSIARISSPISFYKAGIECRVVLRRSDAELPCGRWGCGASLVMPWNLLQLLNNFIFGFEILAGVQHFRWAEDTYEALDDYADDGVTRLVLDGA